MAQTASLAQTIGVSDLWSCVFFLAYCYVYSYRYGYWHGCFVNSITTFLFVFIRLCGIGGIGGMDGTGGISDTRGIDGTNGVALYGTGGIGR